MPRKVYKPEEIVAKLRQVDVLASQGQSTADAIRAIGVSEVTYYRWRQEFGGLKSDQVKRLKHLETENTPLRRAISDLALDKLILQEAVRGNYRAPRVCPGRGKPGDSSHARSVPTYVFEEIELLRDGLLVRVPRSVKLTDMLRWREGLCVCPDEHAPKRRVGVIGIFPNEASITRLIGAVLLEQNDEWLLQCRYMQIEGMAELTPLLIDADPAKLPPMAA